jgi:DNA polymerase III subunit alpha
VEGFYYFPRIDRDFLAKHAEGLIATSGCMAAEIPRAIMAGDMDIVRKKLDWYYDVFGKENYFLELQEHNIVELPGINKALLGLGERYQARYVATNDVHYINQEDSKLQDVLLAVQTGTTLRDPNRMRMGDNSYYLRTPEEMARIFSEVPEAVSNTQLIADRCSIDLERKSYHLPLFEVPDGFTSETYLRHLCEEGLSAATVSASKTRRSATGWNTSWASSTRWGSTPTSSSSQTCVALPVRKVSGTTRVVLPLVRWWLTLSILPWWNPSTMV